MEEAEYRKLAAVEDRMWYFAALHALIDRELSGALGKQPAAELLDAGCGTGGLIYRSEQLHPQWRWTGVDLSPLAVRLAQERWSEDSQRDAHSPAHDGVVPNDRLPAKAYETNVPPDEPGRSPIFQKDQSSSSRILDRSQGDRPASTRDGAVPEDKRLQGTLSGNRLTAGAAGKNFPPNQPGRSPTHPKDPPSSPRILQASLLALPFPNGAFDAITTADVLYHIPDDNAALRELRRVLRPGGTLIVNVPAHPWLWSYHDEAVEGQRRYRRGDLRQQLLSAGFTSIRLSHWNTLLLPLIAARRKWLPPPASGSDVQEFSWPLEVLGRTATALERTWLRMAPLPFGSSLLAVAS